MVESGGVGAGPVTEMPLADHGGLPTARLQFRWEGPQLIVEWCVQCGHTVDVVVRAGQDRGSARSTNRVCAKGGIESHAFGGESVEVRGRVYATAVCRNGVSCVVIAHDENDVWSFGHVGILAQLETGARYLSQVGGSVGFVGGQ